jgi:hypothetical protein
MIKGMPSARQAWSLEADRYGLRTAMINSRAVPVPLSAHTGVSPVPHPTRLCRPRWHAQSGSDDAVAGRWLLVGQCDLLGKLEV